MQEVPGRFWRECGRGEMLCERAVMHCENGRNVPIYTEMHVAEMGGFYKLEG
jgi:hypothetical protein